MTTNPTLRTKAPPVANLATAAKTPGHKGVMGRYVKLQSLDQLVHSQDLAQAFKEGHSAQLWSHVSMGPFNTALSLRMWMDEVSGVDDRPYFAIVDQKNGKAVGLSYFANIRREEGAIEIADVVCAPDLHGTRVVTETFFLMLKRVFEDLSYERCEWRCRSSDIAACRVAERLGFNKLAPKPRLVDAMPTSASLANYVVQAHDWPVHKAAFGTWLAPENFSENGVQLRCFREVLKEKMKDQIALAEIHSSQEQP